MQHRLLLTSARCRCHPPWKSTPRAAAASASRCACPAAAIAPRSTISARCCACTRPACCGASSGSAACRAAASASRHGSRAGSCRERAPAAMPTATLVVRRARFPRQRARAVPRDRGDRHPHGTGVAAFFLNFDRGRASARRSSRARTRRSSRAAPLSALPDAPNFVFCATDLTFGVNFEFSKQRVGDYQAGYLQADDPDGARARATTGSRSRSRRPRASRRCSGRCGSTRAACISRTARTTAPTATRCAQWIDLSDGGVYDNLATEPVIKHADEHPRVRRRRAVPVPPRRPRAAPTAALHGRDRQPGGGAAQAPVP